MHLICCALIAAASALATPSARVRASTSTSFKVVHQDSTIVVDDRSLAVDNRPTFCETVATPGVQWCADVASSLAEPGPELLSTLTMPLPFHLPTKKGSGLVLAKDEKGEDVYVPDPQSSRLCEELVALEGVPNPEALWLLVRDVPGHILVPKLSAAIAYQKSAPKGDFCQYFLDVLVPKVEEAIKAAPDLSSASKAMSDVSYLGVHLGGGYSQTVDLLDNKNLNVIPGVMVFYLAVGRRGDGHNSIFTSDCATGKAIGIDHIADLVEWSRGNVKRDGKASLLESGQLQLEVGDGFKGYAAGAPYDCIHVGAAPVTVPPALKEQLKPGGILLLPVGPVLDQNFVRIVRSADGARFTETKLFSVRYVPLTTAAAQLQRM